MRALETLNKILAIGMLLLFVGILMLLPGCKILKNQKLATKDSVSVNQSSQGSVRVDSSGSKSDKTNTKETVYYPQPIYIEGKNGGEPKIIFVPQTVRETGTEKTEQAQIVKDTSWHDAFNSLALLIANKESKSSTRIGFSTFEIIMMIAGGIIVLKMFGPSIIKLITKT